MFKIGFDISTSIIGISLFKKDNFYKFFYIDLTKKKCIFEKSRQVESDLLEINKKFPDISDVYIEDILQSFSRGMSSSKTITQLAKFNGIVSYIITKIFNLIPVYINVNTARKTLGIKIDKNSDKNKKIQVLEWVNEDIGGYNWKTKVISRGKNKGLVKFENFCYDISDAYVICKSGILLNEKNNQ